MTELFCENLLYGASDVCFYHVTYTFQNGDTFNTCLNVKELLARSRGEIWSLIDCIWTQTCNHLVDKRTLNDWALLWVLICTVHFTLCPYHVNYAFQSESNLNTCLNIKELLARRRREIWRLSGCNWCIWLYVLIKSCARFKLNLHSILAWMSRNLKHARNLQFKWLQLDSNPE